MAKKQISGGVVDLFNAATAPVQEPTNNTTVAAGSGGNKTVLSFSVDETLAEKIRYIAYYDRRKLSAVIAEALAQYVGNWKPAPQEKPRKL